MTQNETRISNERLAATLQRLIGKGNAMVGYMDSPEAIEAGAATSLASWQRETEAAMGLALQALRSTPVEADHIDAAIRLTKQIEDVFYHDHPGGALQVRAKVQLILAEALAHPFPNPSPSDGEVSDEMIEAASTAWSKSTGRTLKQIMRETLRAALKASKRGQP